MSTLSQQMSQLSSAEEFLNFFAIEFDQQVVHVNRLHILKRFNQYLRATKGTDKMDDEALRVICRDLLVKAYGDFVRSTPAQEKVFKVFQDQDGKSVGLDSLKSTLPSQQRV
ncbi:MAG: nitrogenase-stabilizing/protective protein NifW [Burkholderiales bacterium]|nr:nitrogenase-stabilizing/protective protein NifW [Burkholderiales bacterium]